MEESGLGDNTLIQLLATLGDRVPRELFDEVLRRGDEMEQALISIIDDDNAWDCDPGDPARWLPLHAVLVLGLKTSARAGLAIFRAIGTAHRLAYEEIDWIAAFWVALLRNKPDSILGEFDAALKNPETLEYIRIVSVEVLTAAAQRAGVDALDSMLASLATIAANPEETLEFRQYVASQLLDFPRPEYRAVAEAIADLKSTIGVMYSSADVELAYDEARDTPEWEIFNDPWEFYSEGAIAQRKQLGQEEFDRMLAEIDLSEPFVRSEPKIGRNDPCPCGSGRKYKKCCMKNSGPDFAIR